MSQAARLQGIVMKLLTITRLDYLESREREYHTFDLAGVAEDACGRLGAGRREVELRLVLDDVVMDGPQEEIAVLAENLIENAFRHAEKLVEATVGRTPDQRPFLRVFNDGGGIDETLLPQLFDTFTKGSKGVTGLGLAIVRRIADGCGARVSVTNRDNGVEFKVIFRGSAIK